MNIICLWFRIRGLQPSTSNKPLQLVANHMYTNVYLIIHLLIITLKIPIYFFENILLLSGKYRNIWRILPWKIWPKKTNSCDWLHSGSYEYNIFYHSKTFWLDFFHKDQKSHSRGFNKPHLAPEIAFSRYSSRGWIL